MKKLIILSLTLCLLGSGVSAGNLIRKACLKAGRTGATTQLCGCIQKVADKKLRKRKDQKLAASFFKDPHKAQEIRQSDNAGDERFWGRYKLWGLAAAEVCAPSKS